MWMVIFLILAAVMFLLGGLIRSGRGLMLIAGYNTMPAEQQDKVDKAVLGKRTGNLLLRMGVWCVGVAIAGWLEISWLNFVMIAVMVGDPFIHGLTIARLISPAPQSKKVSIVIIIICVVVLACLAVMWIYGDADLNVTVEGDAIVIDDMYGVTLPLGDVVDISCFDIAMHDVFPKLVRTNGYGGFDDAQKGHFREPTYGDILLYVHSKANAVIRITSRNEKTVFLNLRNRDDTYALFFQLSQPWYPYREQLHKEWYGENEDGIVAHRDGGASGGPGDGYDPYPMPFEIPTGE